MRARPGASMRGCRQRLEKQIIELDAGVEGIDLQALVPAVLAMIVTLDRHTADAVAGNALPSQSIASWSMIRDIRGAGSPQPHVGRDAILYGGGRRPLMKTVL